MIILQSEINQGKCLVIHGILSSPRVPTTATNGSRPKPLMLLSCAKSDVPPPTTSMLEKPPAARM